jgi:hypothetical protein
MCHEMRSSPTRNQWLSQNCTSDDDNVDYSCSAITVGTGTLSCPVAAACTTVN